MHVMEEKHIDEIKDIMADSYLHKNEVWSAFNLDREVLRVFFENLIKTHLAMEKETSQKLGRELKLNTVIYTLNRFYKERERFWHSYCTMTRRITRDFTRVNRNQK
jgi:hypothetical protein